MDSLPEPVVTRSLITGLSRSAEPARRVLRHRHWWLVPLLLLLLPTLLTLYFILFTPDFADFDYHIF